MGWRSQLLLAIAYLGAGASAQAGPWPRDDGGIFLALTEEREAGGDGYTSFYGEYGISARQTLGFEAGRNGFGDASLLIWLQRGFGRDKMRYAASLGLGLSQRRGESLPVGQIGLSWGRGLSTPLGDGWVAVDTKLRIAARPVTETVRLSTTTELRYDYLVPETGVKSDMTLGVKPWDGIMVIGQLRLEQSVDRDFAAGLAASVVRDIGPHAKLELGLIRPIKGTAEPALKLGAWISF